jgi:hypothetical protein
LGSEVEVKLAASSTRGCRQRSRRAACNRRVCTPAPGRRNTARHESSAQTSKARTPQPMNLSTKRSLTLQLGPDTLVNKGKTKGRGDLSRLGLAIHIATRGRIDTLFCFREGARSVLEFPSRQAARRAIFEHLETYYTSLAACTHLLATGAPPTSRRVERKKLALRKVNVSALAGEAHSSFSTRPVLADTSSFRALRRGPGNCSGSPLKKRRATTFRLPRSLLSCRTRAGVDLSRTPGRFYDQNQDTRAGAP